jgi:putative methionine-R-sulfoxide reductase with GAF domain
VDKNLSFSCTAGVHHFIAPLIIDKDKILGYLILGPVILVMRKPKEEYAAMAHELRIEQDELWNAILEIKTISFHCAQSLLELIKDVAEYTLKLSYQRLIKERGIAPAEDSGTPHVQWLGSAKLNRLLDALLDVAFETSRADIGSVMFYDKTNNELTIKASRGIAENIVKNAKVKMGEGISGIAIKEGRAFLIDTATRDSRITPYLARPQIRSSMVIPLKIEDTVVGVMNVGALNTSPVQFNEESLALMIKLADLATVAIHP